MQNTTPSSPLTTKQSANLQSPLRSVTSSSQANGPRSTEGCKLYSRTYSTEGLFLTTPEFVCFRPFSPELKGLNIPWKNVLLITLNGKEFSFITRDDSYTIYHIDNIEERFSELQSLWCRALNEGHNVGESVHCLNSEDLERLLSHFKVLSVASAGLLNEGEFTTPLAPLYETPVLSHALFRAFDTNNTSSIGLGEWLDCMRILTVGSAKEKLDFSFRVFDSEGTGRLSVSQFELIVRNLASITSFRLPQDEAGFSTYCSRLFRTFPTNTEGDVTLEEFAVGMPNINLQDICGLENFDLHRTKYGAPPRKNGVLLGFGEPLWPLVVAILVGLRKVGLMRQCRPPDKKSALFGESFRILRRNSISPSASSSKIQNKKVMDSLRSGIIIPLTQKIFTPIQETFQQDIMRPLATAVLPLTNNVLNPIKKDVVSTFNRGLENKSIRHTIAFTSIQSQEVKFTELHSQVFIRVRMQYGFDEDTYQHSLGLDRLAAGLVFGNLEAPRRLSSSGRSNSFFFITHDGQLILKTLPRKEAETLLGLLQHYHDYLMDQPDSLLTIYLGLYEIEFKEQRTLFVVMINVFPPGLDISVQYDLKGSTAGRSVNPQGRKPTLSIALKDLDFQNYKKAILLEEATLKKLYTQIVSDAEFLQSEGLNDYSFLLGISSHVPSHTKPCPASRCFYKGIPALDQKEYYYCGIIDILTAYEGVKVIEHAAKSLYQSNFSCIPPFDYAKRFVEFLDSVMLTKRELNLYLASAHSWTSFASVATATGRPVPHSIMEAIHAAAARAPSSLQALHAMQNSSRMDGDDDKSPLRAEHSASMDDAAAAAATPDSRVLERRAKSFEAPSASSSSSKADGAAAMSANVQFTSFEVQEILKDLHASSAQGNPTAEEAAAQKEGIEATPVSEQPTASEKNLQKRPSEDENSPALATTVEASGSSTQRVSAEDSEARIENQSSNKSIVYV